jgi:hypothetical protein
MKRASLLLLIAASALSAFRTDFSLAKRDPNKIPDFFFRFELASGGGGFMHLEHLSHDEILTPTAVGTGPSVGVEFRHVRAGFAIFDANYYSILSLLPLSIGYTIYERPVCYWGRLYGRLPEVCVKATARFVDGFDPPPYIPFVGTLEAVCSADFYGLGLSGSIGMAYVIDEADRNRYPTRRYVDPYVMVEFHLPLLLVGF